MKTFKNGMFASVAVLAVMLTTVLVGCDKDEDVVERTTTYDLQVKDQLGVSGTVKFTESSSTVTVIDITLVGGDEASHPTHIHLNSAVVGGAIAITLSPVVNGHSSTAVTKLDNNSAISYSQLIEFDGYLNIHQSNNNMNTIIAQTDIGGNALTGNNKTYALAQAGVSGVSGNALFEKRKNGTTLVTVSCTGTISGGSHPAVFHVGSVATVGGGPITKTLNPVNGATGKSYTQLSALNNGTLISYDQTLVYDGYLSVHESQLLMESVLCQGNIGSN
jgi:hypothetical protein